MKVKSILITLLALCLCLPALAQDKALPKDIPALKVLAGKGDVRAQVQLGAKYYFGRGVPKDFRAAAGWYGKAAAQGNVVGQYSMGLMYWRGEGVKKDLAGAYYWLSIAAAGDHKRAIDLKPKLAAGLTLAQKANAEKAVRNWLAKQPAKPAPGVSSFAAGQKAYKAGKYQDAIRLFEAELAAEKKKAKPDETTVDRIHGWLGASCLKAGLLEKALEHHRKALTIRLKQTGPNHISVATSYNSIGMVHSDKGEYDKALEYYKESLAIFLKQLGPGHLRVASSYQNLGSLYSKKGEYDKALVNHQESLDIRLKKLGTEHLESGKSYYNIGKVLKAKGDYDKALKNYSTALDILLKKLPKDHPSVAACYISIGAVHTSKGGYAKALVFHLKALDIKLKQLGPDHPHVATFYNSIGYAQLGLNNLAAALAAARKMHSIKDKRLAYMLSFTSEHGRLAYQQTQYPYNLLGTLGSAPDLASAVLHNKGIVLASLLEDQLVAQTSTDPVIRDLNRQLTYSKHVLNKLQLELPSVSDPKARAQHQDKLKAAQAKVEELQQKMARNVAGLGKARRALSINVRDVQQNLAKDTVLLEFIRYSHYLGKDNWQARYGAVVLSRDRASVWVPLGPAKEIDALSFYYGKALKDKRITDKQYVPLLRSLHDRLVAPIVRVVPAGTKTLIICPAGQLNFVNFATFLTPKDRFLCEDYIIKYVASGRDLVPSGTKPVPTQQQLVVFANPNYENKPAVQLASNRGQGRTTLRSGDRDDLRAALILSALPGTQKEADYLKGKSAEWKLAPYVFVGDEAVERTLYNLKSPKVLHLATHGMFLKGQPKPKKDGLEPVGLSGQRKDFIGRLTNPMDRSALMFTGAAWTSKQWAQGATPDPWNDGILTANEVGTLNLKGTWLVTMSACSTGLGDLRSGEGVMGLRRAFIQAGTKNLLMTLWPVSDALTVNVMKGFYEKAMAGKGDAPKALAEVQRDVLVYLRKVPKFNRENIGTKKAVDLAGPFVLSFQNN